MFLTWVLTVAGVVLIFLELGEWSKARNPHAILGIIVTIIAFLQPIGAFFRPHPGSKRRPVFNWIHWLGGNVAHIIAGELKLNFSTFEFINNDLISSSCDNILRGKTLKG